MAYLYNWIRLALCCCWVHCYVVPRAADLTRSVNWIKKETGNTHNIKNLTFLIKSGYKNAFNNQRVSFDFPLLSVDAVYAMAHAVHHMISEKCGNGGRSLCAELGPAPSGRELLKYIRNVSFVGESNRRVESRDEWCNLYSVFFCFFFFYRSTGSACSVQQRWRRLRQLQHLPVPKNRCKQVRLREDRRLERIVSCCCCSI